MGIEKKTEDWQKTLKAFGKAVSLPMKKEWESMKEIAQNIKEFRALEKQPKAPKTSLQRVIENLGTLRWTLLQLSKTYERDGFFRPSSVPEAKIAELYLVLIRESANILLHDLPDHLVFNSDGKETRSFFQAYIYLSSSLPQLVVGFGNNKAHIHRLTEASSYEIHHQSVGNMITSHLKELFESIDTLNRFLSAPS